MGRDRRRARSARSISITQRRDVVVVVVPSTAHNAASFVIFEGVARVLCVICEGVYMCVCVSASWASVLLLFL